MKIGIIGCGNIGGAIARGLSQAGHTLFLFDKHLNPQLQKAGTCCSSLSSLSGQSELLILAVKPQQLFEVASELAPHLQAGCPAVSTLAGVTLQQLGKELPGLQWLRIMPNLAIRYGKGIVGICGQLQQYDALFKPLGRVMRLEESQFDAFSSLAGSGPAFALLLIEAMVDSAIQLGFTSKDGLALASEMIAGTLALLQESGEHPASLRWQIASPGGTTIAGLQAMEECGVRKGVAAAFTAAHRRAKELGKT